MLFNNKDSSRANHEPFHGGAAYPRLGAILAFKEPLFIMNKERVKKYNKEYYKIHKEDFREYYKKNKEKIKAQSKKSSENNAEKLKEYRKKYYKSNKEKRKKYYETNREKILAYASSHGKNNKDKISLRKRERIQNSIKLRLSRSISNSIYRSLKITNNNGGWSFFIPYTVSDLKKHLEKRFQPGMNWENYGSYWHIDHIIPIVAFNFSSPKHSDFKRCWDLKNLQPLPAIENFKKGKKLKKHFQPALLF
ncbi:MAG: hypothetical protein ABIK92_09870 [Pseudomonadota bacterium]